MWTQQLSPQLQRNKQLQDTLLQREEELARLQEENNKLRHFLTSSFVRNLEEKAKKLSADRTRTLKRNLKYSRDGPFNNQDSQPVSKRVCRNLTAEFCSESETIAASEPYLDLWVLRTLGLKDQNTINTPNDSSIDNSPSSSFRYSFDSFTDDAEVTSPDLCAFFPSPCSSHYILNSSFSSPLTTSTPQSYCQSASPQSDYSFQYQEADKSNYSNSAINNFVPICTRPLGEHSTFIAQTQDYKDSEAVIGNDKSLTAFQSPLLQKVNNWTTPFTQSPEKAQFCSSQAHPQERNPKEHLTYSSPLKLTSRWTSSEDTVQFSKSAERFSSSKIVTSSPIATQSLMSTHCHRLASPSVGSAAPDSSTVPRMTQGRRDLAFSMSLNQFSSVKTHSFPQGQAFVRKDNEGRWNFTWVPKQGHQGDWTSL